MALALTSFTVGLLVHSFHHIAESVRATHVLGDVDRALQSMLDDVPEPNEGTTVTTAAGRRTSTSCSMNCARSPCARSCRFGRPVSSPGTTSPRCDEPARASSSSRSASSRRSWTERSFVVPSEPNRADGVHEAKELSADDIVCGYPVDDSYFLATDRGALEGPAAMGRDS